MLPCTRERHRGQPFDWRRRQQGICGRDCKPHRSQDRDAPARTLATMPFPTVRKYRPSHVRFPMDYFHFFRS